MNSCRSGLLQAQRGTHLLFLGLLSVACLLPRAGPLPCHLPCCRYVVRDLLGQGTFGQVFKCVCVDDGEEDSGAIAIKVGWANTPGPTRRGQQAGADTAGPASWGQQGWDDKGGPTSWGQQGRDG